MIVVKLIYREPKKFLLVCAVCTIITVVWFNNFPCINRVLIYPVYRDLVKDKLTLECTNFNISESSNFRLYYKSIDLDYVKQLLDDAEGNLYSVTRDFQNVSGEKINIIIYPEYEMMMRTMELGVGSPAMGAYYCGTIGVLEEEKSSGNLRIDRYKKKSLILHEITHCLLDYMSNGNMPSWFTEGAALYEEFRVYNIEWAENEVYSDHYSLDELEKNFCSLDEIKAYREAFLIIKYIADNYGYEGINSIVKKLGEGKSMKQALQGAINADIDVLLTNGLIK